MGNSMPLDYNTEEFRQLFGNQWQIISDGKCTKYVNTISKEEFVLKLMDYSKTSQSAYRLRQLYSFEQSPRISILKINQSHMQILVQDATKDIKTWLSNQFMSAIQSLMILKRVLQGLLKLRKKYGCFYLTSNMVKVNKNGKILIWINENFEYNSIAYKLPQDQGQQTMLMKVLSFFGSLLPFSSELKNIKTLNQGIIFLNKMMLQKALSQVDYPNNHQYSANHNKGRFVKNNYNQSLQSLDYSKGVRNNKSYKVLITGTSKSITSPKIIPSTKKYADRNPQCFQNISKSRPAQQFTLKLNPVTYESHSESVQSNYSQSSKKSSNENKVFLQNNLFGGRNDLLFLSMGAGQSPKNHSSRADTEEQVKDSKAPSYQKNLSPLQIPSFNSKKNLKKTADDTFSEVRQVLDNFDIDSDTKQAQLRESGQLSSPMRREIHSQLSKIL